MQSIKKHNLKANHNTNYAEPGQRITGCNLSKNTIWKQITTHTLIITGLAYWMQSIKKHNLKANHNRRGDYRKVYETGCNLSKNTIWKQITTVRLILTIQQTLDAIYQRTLPIAIGTESKSQPERSLGHVARKLDAIYQRTLPIAIGTESKSQLKLNNSSNGTYWMQSIKEHSR